MKRVRISLLAMLLCAALPVQAVKAEERGSVAKPHRLAILSTPNNGPETFLHFVETGRLLTPPVARLRHLPDAAVQGSVLPDGSVVVIADYERGRDRSFGSALFRLEPQAGPTLLCDHIAFASRPLVASDGRVFVQRGEPGPVAAGVLRVDSLTLDEVDPFAGSVRTLWRSKGYVAYLAGTFQNDLIVYHLGPSGARLVRIDRESGTERVVLPSLLPFASDFSVTEAGDLVFQNRSAQRTDSWVVERVHLITGERESLEESTGSLAPRAWPRGELTLNGPAGLRRAKAEPLARALMGPADIRAFSSDGMIAAALAYSPGVSAPDIVLLDPSGAELARIVAPLQTRLEVAGFLP